MNDIFTEKYNKFAKTLFEYTFKHASEYQHIPNCVGTEEHVNIHEITDMLIVNTGRFCEVHQSDLLITYETMKNYINTPITQDEDEYFVFAIRRMGVDGRSYLYENISNNKHNWSYAEQYYRKIFIVKISKELNNKQTTCQIVDVTSNASYVFNNYMKQED